MARLAGFLIGWAILAAAGGVRADDPPAQVTVLFDAFGARSDLKRGWGYSALVEYGSRRILFDTGGSLEGFAWNVRTLGVDLGRLDFVVLTHRHGDHTAGLNHVLKVNPGVTVYTPVEAAYFDTPVQGPTERLIRRHVDTAPADMHYFDGKPPDRIVADSPWPGARFVQIARTTEVLPGFWLFPTRSEVAGTLEMNEISMAVATPRGLLVMVGCSHPGIEKILGVAATINPRLYALYGGLHLADVPDAEVNGLAGRFRDQWKFERIGAGHCTGEFGFSALERAFGARFDHAGVGSVWPLAK